MAAPRLALLVAMTLLLSGASSGCYSPTCPSPATPTPQPPSGGGGGGGGGGNSGSCPINTLKLEACANVMNLLRLNVGVPDGEQCCPLLQGLVDLDAAVCLCLAIRANVLGIIVLDVPVDLTLLLNYCHKDRVAGFTCPAN